MRNLYPGSLVQHVDGTSAPGISFTVWDDQVAGNNVTALLTMPDGITPYVAVTDSYGLQQPFRGPDNDDDGPPLFVDTGVGVRFQVNSSTGQPAMEQRLDDLTTSLANLIATGGTGTGVSDHGALSGLTDDDHPQYHTDARGDARYYTQAQVTAAINAGDVAASTADRNRANHIGTQLASSISDFTSAVQAAAGAGTLADNSVTAAKILDGTVGLAELSTAVLSAFPRTDVAQALSTTQQSQARTNLGVPAQLVATVVRTFAQGVPNASEIAALPNPCIVVIAPA